MTERDPIEAWLGTDVEPLQPPAGAFERIHRRARQRKATRALSTVAGAAVIITAATVVPQITNAVHQGISNKVSGEQSESSGPSQSAAARPGALSTSRPGPSLAGTSSAYPAPKDFKPTSVTVTAASVGAVIGTANSFCSRGPCTSVAGTSDYGVAGHWTRVGAPPAGPPNGSSGVGQIRFLDARNGWAYGPALYATHDGGVTWRKYQGLPGRIIDLATAGKTAFAVVASCSGTGVHYAANCSTFALYSTPASADKWARVQGAAAAAIEIPGGLQLTEQHGYLLAGGRIYAGSVSGGSWQQISTPSNPIPPCLVGSAQSASQPGAQTVGLLAPVPGSRAVFLLCHPASRESGQAVLGQLTLYLSPDGGRTWQYRGALPTPAAANSLAVAPGGRRLALATDSGIYYSADQRTWQTARVVGGTPAGGFTYVDMSVRLRGVAVPANPGLHEVFITLDGGQTWHPSVIS